MTIIASFTSSTRLIDIMRDHFLTLQHFERYTEMLHKLIIKNYGKIPLPIFYKQFKADSILKISKLVFEMFHASYSKGEPVSKLKDYFEYFLQSYEIARKEYAELKIEFPELNNEQRGDRFFFQWKCFMRYKKALQMLGFAICLDIPDEQWKRLINIIYTNPFKNSVAQKDALLDRIVAFREPNWEISNHLYYPQVYKPLLQLFTTKEEERSLMLYQFVNSWYDNCYKVMEKSAGEYGFYNRNPENLTEHIYYGFWCVEAVLMAKILNIDDHLCWGHQDYPGDLIRKDDEPSTHPIVNEPQEKISLMQKFKKIFI